MTAAPSYCPFGLSSLNDLYRGRLCAQLLLYQMRYFDDIWYTYISAQDGVPRVGTVAPPSCPLELNILNEPNRGNLLRSITLVPFEIC